MMKKFYTLLILPFVLFGEITVSKSEADMEKTEKKHEKHEVVEKKKFTPPPQLSTRDQDEQIKPEPTTPNFIDPNYQKQFFKTLIFICILIVFAMLIIYVYKRASPMSTISKRNSRGNIKILERRSLSPQTYLYHIQVGDKQFILSESKVDVRNVSTLDWPQS